MNNRNIETLSEINQYSNMKPLLVKLNNSDDINEKSFGVGILVDL